MQHNGNSCSEEKKHFGDQPDPSRAAGYDSVLSLTQDIVNDNRLVPMLLWCLLSSRYIWSSAPILFL
jgi:hypothetical protein